MCRRYKRLIAGSSSRNSERNDYNMRDMAKCEWKFRYTFIEGPNSTALAIVCTIRSYTFPFHADTYSRVYVMRTIYVCAIIRLCRVSNNAAEISLTTNRRFVAQLILTNSRWTKLNELSRCVYFILNLQQKHIFDFLLIHFDDKMRITWVIGICDIVRNKFNIKNKKLNILCQFKKFISKLIRVKYLYKSINFL